MFSAFTVPHSSLTDEQEGLNKRWLLNKSNEVIKRYIHSFSNAQTHKTSAKLRAGNELSSFPESLCHPISLEAQQTEDAKCVQGISSCRLMLHFESIP